MKQLKKSLTYWQILFITVNSIMGTGIFFLPAVGAKISGPASILSWVILSLICIYISMCFGELASMFPTSGGVYEFSKQAYGRFFSFIVGWTTFLAANVTIAMLVVGAIQYLLPLPLLWPKIMISLLFVFIFNYVAYRGMKTSSTMLIAFGFITISTLILLIVPSLLRFNLDNYKPFFVVPLPYIFFTIFFIAETFFGWETSTFLAGETKEGAKIMPKALIYGTIIISLISLLFVFSTIGAVGWKNFGNSKAPLAFLGSFHYKSFGQDLFTIMVYLSIIGSVAGWIVSSPRLILSMASDKLFPKQLSKIHPKYYTPYKAIIFQLIIVTILILVGSASYILLLEMLLPFLLFMYSVVLIALVVLRYKRPFIKRYYKVPFGKTGPLVIVCFMILLMILWFHFSPNAWQLIRLGLSFIVFGIPFYLLIESYYDKKFIIKINESSALLTLLTENLFLPKKIRHEVLKALSLKEKKILEYGAGVGTLTKWLSLIIGKHGKIYALDISHKKLKIGKRRVRYYNNVEFIHDKKMLERVHPKIKKVDAIVSIGTISYVQKLNKVLRELRNLIKKDGKIIFVEFDKYFKLIPNIEWLNKDEKIKEIFNKNGFDVSVERRKAFLWEYIFIRGKRK